MTQVIERMRMGNCRFKSWTISVYPWLVFQVSHRVSPAVGWGEPDLARGSGLSRQSGGQDWHQTPREGTACSLPHQYTDWSCPGGGRDGCRGRHQQPHRCTKLWADWAPLRQTLPAQVREDPPHLRPTYTANFVNNNNNNKVLCNMQCRASS